MKGILILTVIIGVLFSVVYCSYGQEPETTTERLLVIREGKQSRNNIVVVDVYLIEDVLEALVGVRMYAEKPKINDVILVGPKLGRIHYKSRETVFAKVEEEEPYPITKQSGIIVFGKRTKTKQPEGTLTKELFRIKIPREKIVPNKRYQLWVQVESKTRAGGTPLKFKFDLENLAELIEQQKKQ